VQVCDSAAQVPNR